MDEAAGEEEQYQALELLRQSGFVSWIAVAETRECLLEEHCRAHHLHPLWSQCQQPYRKGCRYVAGVLVLGAPLVPCQL